MKNYTFFVSPFSTNKTKQHTILTSVKVTKHKLQTINSPIIRDLAFLIVAIASKLFALC